MKLSSNGLRSSTLEDKFLDFARKWESQKFHPYREGISKIAYRISVKWTRSQTPTTLLQWDYFRDWRVRRRISPMLAVHGKNRCEHKYGISCFYVHHWNNTNTTINLAGGYLDRLVKMWNKKREIRDIIVDEILGMQSTRQAKVGDTVTERSRLDSLLFRFINCSDLCFHIFSLVSAKSVSKPCDSIDICSLVAIFIFPLHLIGYFYVIQREKSFDIFMYDTFLCGNLFF